MLKQNQSLLVKTAIIISAVAIIFSLSYLLGWKNGYRQSIDKPSLVKTANENIIANEKQIMPVAPVLPTKIKK